MLSLFAAALYSYWTAKITFRKFADIGAKLDNFTDYEKEIIANFGAQNEISHSPVIKGPLSN